LIRAKPLPRVWEAQGTPEPQKSAPVQSGDRSTHSAQRSSHPAAGGSRAAGKRAAAAGSGAESYSNWHQQPATTQAHPQQNSHPPAQSSSEFSQEVTLTRTAFLRFDRVQMEYDSHGPQENQRKKIAPGNEQANPFPSRLFFACRYERTEASGNELDGLFSG